MINLYSKTTEYTVLFFNVFMNLAEWLVAGGGMWNLDTQHKLMITNELLRKDTELPFFTNPTPLQRKAMTTYSFIALNGIRMKWLRVQIV